MKMTPMTRNNVASTCLIMYCLYFDFSSQSASLSPKTIYFHWRCKETALKPLNVAFFFGWRSFLCAIDPKCISVKTWLYVHYYVTIVYFDNLAIPLRPVPLIHKIWIIPQLIIVPNNLKSVPRCLGKLLNLVLIMNPWIWVKIYILYQSVSGWVPQSDQETLRLVLVFS